MILKLLKKDILIIETAYQIEKNNPGMDFISVNKLTQQKLAQIISEPEEVWLKKLEDAFRDKPKLRIVK